MPETEIGGRADRFHVGDPSWTSKGIRLGLRDFVQEGNRTTILRHDESTFEGLFLAIGSGWREGKLVPANLQNVLILFPLAL